MKRSNKKVAVLFNTLFGATEVNNKNNNLEKMNVFFFPQVSTNVNAIVIKILTNVER